MWEELGLFFSACSDPMCIFVKMFTVISMKAEICFPWLKSNVTRTSSGPVTNATSTCQLFF